MCDYVGNVDFNKSYWNPKRKLIKSLLLSTYLVTPMIATLKWSPSASHQACQQCYKSLHCSSRNKHLYDLFSPHTDMSANDNLPLQHDSNSPGDLLQGSHCHFAMHYSKTDSPYKLNLFHCLTDADIANKKYGSSWKHLQEGKQTKAWICKILTKWTHIAT